MDLSGSFDGEAGSSERVLDCGDVALHLADWAEADLAEGQDQGVGGERVVAAVSLHCCSVGLQVTLHWGA